MGDVSGGIGFLEVWTPKATRRISDVEKLGRGLDVVFGFAGWLVSRPSMSGQSLSQSSLEVGTTVVVVVVVGGAHVKMSRSGKGSQLSLPGASIWD